MKSYNQTLRLVSFLLIALGMRESEQSSCEDNSDTLFIANEYIHSYSLDASIYPNPATDKIIIHLSDEDEKDAQVTLQTIDGRLILSKSFFHPGKEPITVNTNDIPSGLYIVYVSTATGQFVSKVIVQK